MIFLTFQLSYHTLWGQQVCVCGSTPELGSFDESKALVLNNDGDLWNIQLSVHHVGNIDYYYFIKEGGHTIRREWGENRRLFVENNKTFYLQDLWKTEPYHRYLYSSVFTESVFAHTKKTFSGEYYSQSILLNVICPYVRKDQKLVISGDNEKIGNWNLEKALPLDCVRNGEWQIVLDAAFFSEDVHYKFVIVDAGSLKAIHWEDGGNRTLYVDKVRRVNCVLVEMGLVFHYHSFAYKGTGTAIPVFSLRSEDSFGIGDFLDLRKMIDWAVLTRQQLIQVLPLNDTTTTHTWKDSYPYSAISIYALNPMYLGYGTLPLNDKKKQNAYINRAKELNKLPQLDYEKVLRLKTDYGKDLFAQNGNEVLASDEYRAFYRQNESWLFPYACYCYLRDSLGTAEFSQWGEFSVFRYDQLEHLLKTNPEAKQVADYYCFLQFLLHQQLYETKEYAHQKGVVLKGDIPIGINRSSIDAWTTPYLFNMNTQTGAPPDDFSIYGQNWSFPTYNWHAMAQEDFTWWKNRFKKMADYFDAYRIDHILGFFRIWEIPLDAVQGLLGHFSPALPYSVHEINGAGMFFDEERLLQPFIHEHFLYDFFGPDAGQVMQTYLDVSGWQRFRLKSFCNTQQKIRHLFEGETDLEKLRIRDGLYALCTEVLFVRDPYEPDRFHPRIAAQYTHSYRYLDDAAKNAFNRLYDAFFYHRHNAFWREQAIRKLPQLVSSTSMLPCGEDLGMVPACVPAVMDELQILSLEIQRMPKDPNRLFADLSSLPYLSVCTTSTHDMSPVRAWWREDRDITQQFYNEVLHHEGEAPPDCSPELCREILELHLQASSMWVILPWQDWMSIDGRLSSSDPEGDRINIPANPEHYWRYRMHLSLDALLQETDFNDTVRRLAER